MNDYQANLNQVSQLMDAAIASMQSLAKLHAAANAAQAVFERQHRDAMREIHAYLAMLKGSAK